MQTHGGWRGFAASQWERPFDDMSPGGLWVRPRSCQHPAHPAHPAHRSEGQPDEPNAGPRAGGDRTDDETGNMASTEKGAPSPVPAAGGRSHRPALRAVGAHAEEPPFSVTDGKAPHGHGARNGSSPDNRPRRLKTFH